MGVKRGSPSERKLTLSGRLYLPEIAKGMMFSIKHMFRPSVAISYPDKPITLTSEFRGRPVLVAENGKERCVACGLCARACPPLAISMQAAQIPDTTDPKERYPERFEIDMLRCIYCGFCEEVCPEEAIVMSPEYDYVFTERKQSIMDKSKLIVEKSRLQPRLDFLAERRNKQFGKQFNFPEENNVHTYRNRG